MLAGCATEHRADLVIINGTEPETLDPAIMTGFAEMRIAQGLFEGLTRPDPQTGQPVPGLAESWETSPDGCTYTFRIRTNAVWSTGEPITAHDVIFSWLRVLDPATGADYAGQFFYIKGAEEYYNATNKDPSTVGLRALDARTLQVELKHPAPFFLELCALPAFAVVPKSVIEKHGDRWIHARPLPTSGPYELVFWRMNDRVRLRKNYRYWDAANTHTEVIDFLPVGAPNTALNLYETGAADVILDKDMVPVELLDLLLQRPDCHRFDYLGTYFIRFNVTKPPFDDVRVRKAFAMAIDKRRIVEKITRAGEKVATHFTPDGVADYTPPAGLDYNPVEARRLLAEAGYPDGKRFPRVQYSFDASALGPAKLNAKIAVELQQMWHQALGVEVELRQLERKIFFSAQSRLDYDISRSSWVADYNDPNTFLDIFLSTSGNNRTGWKNARYDELIKQANMQTDKKLRAALFYEAEKILVAEEVPIVPLYFYAGINFYDTNRVQGIYPNILDLHPLNAIRKTGRGSGADGRGP
ncbi:MAG: peptide ABC transporter substrate-binding protein [Verrucomicrobiae bacterium]|nr:peptide ABC transporter substrate-binding protein [Verrucomicrobiae bacterium]